VTGIAKGVMKGQGMPLFCPEDCFLFIASSIAPPFGSGFTDRGGLLTVV